MRLKSLWVLLWLVPGPLLLGQTDKPLRIFLRAGPNARGPGQHDGPRFLAEWKTMLNGRGASCDGAIGFPTAEQLARTDVLVMYAAEGGTLSQPERANLEQFLRRGGGIVAIHDSVCGNDPHWFKTIIGGAGGPGPTQRVVVAALIDDPDDTRPHMAGGPQFCFCVK